MPALMRPITQKPKTITRAESRFPMRSSVQSILILAFNKAIAEEMNVRIRTGRVLPTPTDYVKAITQAAMERSYNIVVNALAGSGKSTTLEHIASKFPGANIQASTIHSFCMRSLQYFLKAKHGIKNVEVQADKIPCIIRQILSYDTLNADEKTKADMMMPPANRLVDLARTYTFTSLLPEPQNSDLNTICAKHDIELPDQVESGISEEDVFGLVRKTLIASNRNISTIDFVDMIHICLVLNVTYWQHDLIMVDECLPGWTPILLADGSSKTIAEIVDNKLPVEVLAFNTETGKQEACRVTAWSKTINQKPLVKIKAKWRQRKGTSQPTNFIVCTTDHKIWANNQWVPAGKVKSGMDVQIETSAKKAQFGKITSKGKRALAESISGRNSAGVMGKHPGPGFSGNSKSRGGNGKGLSLAEQTLLSELGINWTFNHPVATKLRSSGPGYPTCYKIDIANTESMIAVEVDGHSHRSRKDQDKKKTEFLESKGWRVIRVTNREAIQDTNATVSKILHEEALAINAKAGEDNSCSDGNCPIKGTITSVEPIEIRDSYVYDLTIDKCHNFYANGILVHNCQDLDPMQIAVIKRASINGQVCFVGDRNQAIYGFRGADVQAIESVIEQFKARELPLSTCWRCPTAVIAEVQKIVPAIEAAPNAIEGKVDTLASHEEMHKMAEAGDFVLCRTTAPLVETCMQFIRQGKAATVRGRDIGQGLVVMVDKIKRRRSSKDKGILDALYAYREDALAKLQHPSKDAQRQSLGDKIDTLLVLSEECETWDQIKEKIRSIFSDTQNGELKNLILCSTAHKAKGLESERVFIIHPELMPLPFVSKDWQKKQEMNLKYVAITRATRELYWVEDGKPKKAVAKTEPEVIEEWTVSEKPAKRITKKAVKKPAKKATTAK